ncbi:uncharacterized protein LOC119583256 [Penaeus monodon]|uniref:uncharacterized protein LOC119583256 n=1 Tax=Penaeus monodon TaxID=6687 RepID=UPI0018A6F54E|nr:uncharacterized protein LOC119583256 [Penaeus monodon]
MSPLTGHHHHTITTQSPPLQAQHHHIYISTTVVAIPCTSPPVHHLHRKQTVTINSSTPSSRHHQRSPPSQANRHFYSRYCHHVHITTSTSPSPQANCHHYEHIFLEIMGNHHHLHITTSTSPSSLQPIHHHLRISTNTSPSSLQPIHHHLRIATSISLSEHNHAITTTASTRSPPAYPHHCLSSSRSLKSPAINSILYNILRILLIRTVWNYRKSVYHLDPCSRDWFSKRPDVPRARLSALLRPSGGSARESLSL